MFRSPFRTVCELVVGIGVLGLATHTWLAMGLIVPVTVSGRSMEPTLEESRRVVVDRTAFTFREPRRWEIVVFRSPQAADRLSVKRIVGLPGETITFAEGQLHVDDKPIAMPPGLRYDRRYDDSADPQTGWRLGPYEYFVLGDNAAASDDSRNWHPRPGLEAKLLLGRPLGVR